MLDCNLNEEDLRLKITGCGDGIKNIPKSTPSKRVPVPSARKFTATTTPAKNNALRLQLERHLNDLDVKMHTPKMRKVNSVAEITPTKSKKKKLRKGTGGPSTDGHATPRYVEGTTEAASERWAREQAGWRMYQRLVLFAWRRNRARLATLAESSRRQQDQIGRLERETYALKGMVKVESEKADNAVREAAWLKRRLDEIEQEKESAVQDKCLLETKLDETHQHLDNLIVEMGNTKNDLQQYKHQARHLEHQLDREREKLKRKREERAALLQQISTQDTAIKVQDETIQKLEETIRNLEKALDEVKQLKDATEKNYETIFEELKAKEVANDNLQHKLRMLKRDREDLEGVIDDLQLEISQLMQTCDDITDKYTTSQTTILELYGQRNSWWINLKQVACLSAEALKMVCYIMLPALPKQHF